MKSMTFQPLRRYEPLWKMKPRATILIPASKQKIPMKYGSVFSCEDDEQRNDKRIVPYQIQVKAHLGYPLCTHDGQPYVQVQHRLLKVQMT